MVITKVLKQRGKAPKFSIYIDGRYAFDVSDATLMKFGLTMGRTLQDDMIERIKDAELFYLGQKIALNYISYRPRSSREVAVRLNEKGVPLGIAQRVVQHFLSVSLVNDVEFAKMYVRDKLRARPVGRGLLKQQLLAKGIQRQIIDEALAEYVSEEDQRKAAALLADRRLKQSRRSFSKLEPLKQRKRLLDFLLRRGFSHDIATKTVRKLFTE